MKYNTLLVFLLCFNFSQAQLKGSVTDETGVPLSYATVHIKNTTLTTSTNANGEYIFKDVRQGTYEVWAQQLDYISQHQLVNYNQSTNLNFQLKSSRDDKSEIEESKDFGKNLIKKAIQNRRENAHNYQRYSHSFYSKGGIEITNFPKKIIGYDIQQLDPSLKLDSLRNKYVFLSETFSKVEFQHRNDYKETIIASKTSGDNQGYAFHSSYYSDFDFYKNESYRNWKLISPIANNALVYYNYDLVDYVKDVATERMVYKIKVTPIRDVDPVVDGYIYIIDGSFEIYGVDFSVKGYRVGTPSVQEYSIKQQYVYDNAHQAFIKHNQTISFSGKILVFEFRSEYQQLYTDWSFENEHPKGYFSNQLVTYDKNSNQKDARFWEQKRPIVLTALEKNDFVTYDQGALEKGTKQYQDSIDKVNNRFNPIKLIVGYKYRNSYNNETYKYNGLLSTFAFNAVQGFNVTTGLSYLRENPEKETYYEFGGLVNYGIAENKPRFSGYYTQLFNRQNYAKLDVSGGAVVHQFGEEYPIKKLINSLASSYFGKNFAKFYKKEFIRAAYEQELFNGLIGKVDLEYANRLPLFNNTINSPFVKDRLFSSNNPLDPTDFENPGFVSNHIFKLRLKATYHIGQKYISYPHKKVNIRNSKYPSLTLAYENGFGSTDERNNYSLLNLSTKYETSLGVVGNLGLYINGGKFFNADDISFMDYKHFYGNETFIGTNQNYLGKFNLMPYYSMSTNKDFVEWHAEHNFKGYVLNKIPLVRELQYHLIIGAHGMQTGDRNPYFEYSVGLDNFGFKKFRPFRIDFFRSNYNGTSENGIIIGIKLLDKMN